MARRTRDPKKEASWRKLTAAQRHSGQTVREYCQANGLAESSFWFWKRELARRDAERPGRRPVGARPERRQGRERTPRVPALIPVTIGPAMHTTAPLEVLLSQGVSVRVASSCDEALLRMVLSVLESGA